jgi:hypothetical protein
MIKRQTHFRHKRDLVSEEMVAALLDKTTYDFNGLFQVVHEKLRARKAASGGEEMLRLRVYEKLQIFVNQGLVDKKDKKYSAVKPALQAHAAGVAAAVITLQQRRGAMMHIE